jgi:hypothetical protein
MNKLFYLLMFLMATCISANAQFFPEAPFGLDLPVARWTENTDEYYLNGPRYGRVVIIRDIQSLRFLSGQDTTEIILMLDAARGQIHWLRCSATDYPRAVEWFGTYGGSSVLDRKLWSPTAMAVSSGAAIFDHVDDYIYVADYMYHRIRAYKFAFDPSSPGADRLDHQFDIEIDPKFYPRDLNYIDFNTGIKSDNILLATDNCSGRLFVFSHEGAELSRYDLNSLGGGPAGLYSSLASRLDSMGNVYAYLLDYAHADVDLVEITANGNFEYLNSISMGDNMDTVISDIVYSDQFGLWAVERYGPHIYQLAPDLSHVIREISGENLNPDLIGEINKIIIHPERLIVLEDMNADYGILSFATAQRSAKRNTDEEIIPYRFALSQNYPNPFNPSTIIRYEIPKAANVTLTIYNILGQRVKTLVDSYENAGPHSVIWNGTNQSDKAVSSGVYFSKLSSGESTEIKKMLLLK